MEVKRINSQGLMIDAEDIITNRKELFEKIKKGENPGEMFNLYWLEDDDIIQLYYLLKSHFDEESCINQVDEFLIRTNIANLLTNIPKMKISTLEKICHFSFDLMKRRVFYRNNVEMGVLVLLVLLERNHIKIDISDSDLYDIFYKAYYQEDESFEEFYPMIQKYCTIDRIIP